MVVEAEELGRTFSMLDLWLGRVAYVHDGTETRRDSFTFSVFSADKKQVPPSLHRFHIDVSPVNDAPLLSLPDGDVFTVVEKSKRKVGRRAAADASRINVNAA